MRAHRRLIAAIAGSLVLLGLPGVSVLGRIAPAGATGPPKVSVGAGTIYEGNRGARTLFVPVTLSVPPTTSMTVFYQLVNDTATGGISATNPSGADFANFGGGIRTLTFSAGQVAKNVNVKVFPDTTVEGDETLHVQLSAPTGGYALGAAQGVVTIKDDESFASSRLDVTDVAIAEGDVGKRNVTFTFALSEPQTTTVSFDARIFPVDATGNYASGTVPPGTDVKDGLGAAKKFVLKPPLNGVTPVSRTLAVTVFADIDVESDEIFELQLSNLSSNIVLGHNPGYGLIVNDDTDGIRWAEVQPGFAHTCGRTTLGAVYCWGDNTGGQLGNGTTSNSSTPVGVPTLTTGVTQITSGRFHTCALTNTGQAYCWGSNQGGQLGDGTVNDALSPVLVSGLPGTVSQISAGYQHTCAVMLAGTVYCWGRNDFGDLGDGTATDSPTPVAVQGLTTAVTVAAGYRHTCATTTTGIAYCWGLNDEGELGNSSVFQSLVPITVPLPGIRKIAASYGFTCAVTSLRATYCWGANSHGQIGDGSLTTRFAPVRAIAGGTAQVAIGEKHACAVSRTGVARCWGFNSQGQLGLGDNADRGVPTVVPTLSGVVQVGAGSSTTCAVTSIGNAYCWGANPGGNLGNGTTFVDSNVPTLVSAP